MARMSCMRLFPGPPRMASLGDSVKLAACQHVQFSLVQSLSRVWLFATPWTAAHQASLSIANFRSLLKLMSIESVMPSYHLILCCPLLLLPSIFPSIRVFSKRYFGVKLTQEVPPGWSLYFPLTLLIFSQKDKTDFIFFF